MLTLSSFPRLPPVPRLFLLLLLRVPLLGLYIDIFRQFSKFLVGFSFFHQSFSQQRSLLGLTKQLRVCDHRAVARDLVVFHALGGGDERSVHHGVSKVFPDNLRSFFDQTFHTETLLSGTFFTELLEYLLQALDVSPGLLQMFPKPLPQFI